MSFYTNKNSSIASFSLNIREFLIGNLQVLEIDYDGASGDGEVSLISQSPSASSVPEETWTLTVAEVTTDGVARFTVTGTVSGQTADAYSGSFYDNGVIRFFITNGGTPWQVGDTINFKVKPGASVPFKEIKTFEYWKENIPMSHMLYKQRTFTDEEAVPKIKNVGLYIGQNSGPQQQHTYKIYGMSEQSPQANLNTIWDRDIIGETNDPQTILSPDFKFKEGEDVININNVDYIEDYTINIWLRDWNAATLLGKNGYPQGIFVGGLGNSSDPSQTGLCVSINTLGQILVGAVVDALGELSVDDFYVSPYYTIHEAIQNTIGTSYSLENDWVMFTIVVENSTKYITIYINGTQLVSLDFSATGYTLLPHLNKQTVNGEYCTVIYNEAKTASQISDLYTSVEAPSVSDLDVYDIVQWRKETPFFSTILVESQSSEYFGRLGFGFSDYISNHSPYINYYYDNAPTFVIPSVFPVAETTELQFKYWTDFTGSPNLSTRIYLPNRANAGAISYHTDWCRAIHEDLQRVTAAVMDPISGDKDPSAPLPFPPNERINSYWVSTDGASIAILYSIFEPSSVGGTKPYYFLLYNGTLENSVDKFTTFFHGQRALAPVQSWAKEAESLRTFPVLEYQINTFGISHMSAYPPIGGVQHLSSTDSLTNYIYPVLPADTSPRAQSLSARYSPVELYSNVLGGHLYTSPIDIGFHNIYTADPGRLKTYLGRLKFLKSILNPKDLETEDAVIIGQTEYLVIKTNSFMDTDWVIFELKKD